MLYGEGVMKEVSIKGQWRVEGASSTSHARDALQALRTKVVRTTADAIVREERRRKLAAPYLNAPLEK